jgi:hypothetical protein
MTTKYGRKIIGTDKKVGQPEGLAFPKEKC